MESLAVFLFPLCLLEALKLSIRISSLCSSSFPCSCQLRQPEATQIQDHIRINYLAVNISTKYKDNQTFIVLLWFLALWMLYDLVHKSDDPFNIHKQMCTTYYEHFTVICLRNVSSDEAELNSVPCKHRLHHPQDEHSLCSWVHLPISQKWGQLQYVTCMACDRFSAKISIY